MKRAIYVIFFTYFTCICFCIPLYFTFAIKPRDGDEVCFNESICDIDLLNLREMPYDLGIMNSHVDSSRIVTNLDIERLLSNMNKNNSTDFEASNSNDSSQLENEENVMKDSKKLQLKKRKGSKRFIEESYLYSISSGQNVESKKLMNKSKILSTIVNKINDGSYILEYDEELMDNFNNNQQNDKLQLDQGQSQLTSDVELNYTDQLKKWVEESLNATEKELLFKMFLPVAENQKIRTWRVTFSDVALKNNGRLQKINFWVYSVLNKIIPCCALTYLSLALIRTLYQSNERHHRLRGHGQQQFYSQAGNSSFYNVNPIQNHLSIELMNSTNAQKNKENEHQIKSLPNSPNSPHSSNLNLLDPNQRSAYSNNKSSNNLRPTKMNESVSSNLISNINLSALSPTKSKIELNEKNHQSNESLQTSSCKRKTNEKTDLNSNHSLNQQMNLSSRNNSTASYIYPSQIMNTSSSLNNRSCKLNNNTNCDRTTRMLLAILFLFLITEIPSGILSLLAGILGEVFFYNVYINLGEVIDLLALINNGVNFILYCTTSRQFRKTFQKTFCCNCICLFRPTVKQTADISINSKTANQLRNKNSIPNEKVNLFSQKINVDNVNFDKKVSLSNEIDDDDQELVTLNETKQNSSTLDMEDDCFDNDESNFVLNRLRKSSIGKQDTIVECKESYIVEPNLRQVERESLDFVDDNLKKKSSNSNINSTRVIERSNDLEQSSANGSVIKNELKTNDELKLDEESPRAKTDNLIKSDIRLRMHRNSSIDSSSDQSNRRGKLLHRYNDSRKRRRKTIANMEADCKKSSLSTCV